MEIEGGDIVLRPHRRETAGEVLEACAESAAELYRYVPWRNDTVEDVLAFFDQAEKERQCGRALHLSILAKRDGGFLGAIGLNHVDPFTPRAEVGYWMRTSRCGLGYATQALRVLVNHCDTALGLVRLTAAAAADNLASQRVLTKCGFTREGFQPKGELCHGRWHNLILFGRLTVAQS